ncbi:MAG: class I SAM-dependent methyltransferase, partial [Pseudolabrys sp.]
MSDFKAFQDLERQGWSDPGRVWGYVELFASASDQAIGSLLEAVNAKPKLKALDLCCGQGNVSEALASCGCEVTGVDFSPAMLAFANARVPNAVFIRADAQELPFDNEEFDIIVSNLGVCHVPDQPRALLEARRVLGRGGRFAMTVWCGPDVSPCFEIVYDAIKAHGSPDVTAPGFNDVDLSIVNCVWDLDSPGRLSEIYEKGTVRAAMVLASQPPQSLVAIRQAMAEAVQKRFA